MVRVVVVVALVRAGSVALGSTAATTITMFATSSSEGSSRRSILSPSGIFEISQLGQKINTVSDMTTNTMIGDKNNQTK